MSTSFIKADFTLDCKGLACPMPIVKTKKAIEELSAGQVIEIQATDKGSLADLQGWAKITGHHYLGTLHEGDVLKHFIRKANPDDMIDEIKFPYTLTNKELLKKVASGEKAVILDVREPAEYAFNRIPGAVSIPLGELNQRIHELNSDQEIHIVCRTGTRSDLACRQLAKRGFKNVSNVIPGMSGWTGPTEHNV